MRAIRIEIFERYTDIRARVETPEQIDELIRRLQIVRRMFVEVNGKEPLPPTNDKSEAPERQGNE